MSMVSTCLEGPRVALPRLSRPTPLTPAQKTARRNAAWLFFSEVGMHDPAQRRVRPHTTFEIADLFGVSVRAVQLGIASARRLRGIANGPGRDC